MPTPNAVATTNPASAMVSASLCLIPERPCRPAHATGSQGGPQRNRAAPQQGLNHAFVPCTAGRRISAAPDALVKLRVNEHGAGGPQDGLRTRGEQAIAELAQALLDSQMLENALAAAFGAREKAVEAQQAAMSALNLPSAGDVERLERRLRSFSQRLEDVEEQIDEVARDIAEVRRELARPARRTAPRRRD